MMGTFNSRGPYSPEQEVEEESELDIYPLEGPYSWIRLVILITNIAQGGNAALYIVLRRHSS